MLPISSPVVLYLTSCMNLSAALLSQNVFFSPCHVKIMVAGYTSLCLTFSLCRHLFTGLKTFLLSASSLVRSSKKENVKPSHLILHFSFAISSALSQADECRKRTILMDGHVQSENRRQLDQTLQTEPSQHIEPLNHFLFAF